MSIRLTPGKIAGLKAMADERGVIAALALDQRGLLKGMLAKALGGEAPSEDIMSEFKRLTVSVLTREASSVLLDVEYGLPAAQYRNGKGLLLAYEKAGYSPDRPEKLPSLTEGWSARRLKEAGADAVKILIFYTPFEDAWVNEQKKAFVERAGAECRDLDMPFFLEFLSYELNGGDETTAAYARRKPEIVQASITEFSKERYGADVLKVEVPVQLPFTSGTRVFQGEEVFTRQQAKDLLLRTAEMADKPLVYLSAGVSSAAFLETLELAIESGVEFNGVLCGRATWQEGVPIFAKQGARALEEWLESTGLDNVRKLNEVLKSARPWYETAGMRG
jgi:tagatose 1,6-diphosphate aldolase